MPLPPVEIEPFELVNEMGRLLFGAEIPPAVVVMSESADIVIGPFERMVPLVCVTPLAVLVN